MTFRSKFLLGCCSMMFAAVPVAALDEDEATYIDESGEEIFGENYEPVAPDDLGPPLFAGQPASGKRLSPLLQTLNQEQLAAILATPTETDPTQSVSEGDAAINESLTQLKSHIPTRSEFRSSVVASELLDYDDGPSAEAFDADARMTAHFVYAGQGDAAILEFPCGVAVIDVGGEYGTQQGATDGARLFADYLDNFFDQRPHLNRTVDLMVFTHPHADHIMGTRELLAWTEEPIRIRNLVDNGHTGTSGSLKRQTDFRRWAIGNGAGYSAIRLNRQATATGVTNRVIDPINCGNVDPIITAFWGDRGTYSGDFRNPNNHSMIIRVDFGRSSFLFTGDLEDAGEAELREEFRDNLEVFDVDVYQVSHHGADRDTSRALLDIMTPKIAVISMGEHQKRGNATAWDHGHPRSAVVGLLEGSVSDERPRPRRLHVFDAQESEPRRVQVTRAIYGTGWEGDVLITVTAAGQYTVETMGQ